MKNLRLIKIIILVLVLFFSLQLTSHIFLKLGLKKTDPPRSGMLKMSTIVFPLDAEALYEYSFALLEEHAFLKNSGQLILKKSIKGFKTAIGLNPLLYTAHFNLARAYQIDEIGNTTLYDDALKYFKRAAIIRGSRAHISVEVINKLLSLWPFLPEKDKEFCKKLLEESIQEMTGNDFESILKLWSLKIKDINFFKKSLIKKPVLYKKVAFIMEQIEIEIKTRQNFLAEYEVYYLEYFKNGLESYLKKSKDQLKALQSSYNRLKKNILGYYRLLDKKNLNKSLFFGLKKRLILKIMDKLLSNNNHLNPDEKDIYAVKYIEAYLKDFTSQNDRRDLYQFLEKKSFFLKPGLKELLIELLIRFKMNEIKWVIQKGEKLRNSYSFVKEEQIEDYSNALLILSDAYIVNSSFKKAASVLDEIERIFPEKLDLYWVRCKMLNVKNQMLNLRIKNEESGDRRQEEEKKFKVEELEERREKIEDRIFETDTFTQLNTQHSTLNTQPKELEEKCELIRKSRVIDLKKTRFKKTVYFLAEPVIVILLNEKFKNKIKNKHLLQVFVDGWISYEQYLSQVKEKVEVKVKEGEWNKVEVEVRIR